MTIPAIESDEAFLRSRDYREIRYPVYINPGDSMGAAEQLKGIREEKLLLHAAVQSLDGFFVSFAQREIHRFQIHDGEHEIVRVAAVPR